MGDAPGLYCTLINENTHGVELTMEQQVVAPFDGSSTSKKRVENDRVIGIPSTNSLFVTWYYRLWSDFMGDVSEIEQLRYSYCHS